MSELSAIFENTLDTMLGSSPLPGMTPIAADAACNQFERVVTSTLLPRRVTLRANDGARISVVAKNRRIIKLTEVHPPELWNGQAAPEATECENDYDTFGHPFALALNSVIGSKQVEIEQGFLSDPIGSVTSGYPASSLSEHVKKSQERAPVGEQMESFFEAQSTLPRARFGREIEITIPKGSDVSHDWMQARIDEALLDLADTKSDLRFLVLNGTSPRAFALAWFNGEGMIALSDNPENFDALEQGLHALRPYL